MTYIFFLIIALLMLIADYFLKHKKIERFRKKKDFDFKTLEKNRLFIKLDKFINKSKFLCLLKDKNVKKLELLNSYSRETNNFIILNYSLFVLVFALAVGTMLLKLLSMWSVVIIIVILLIYVMFYAAVIFLDMRIARIHKFFPAALQIFTDEYVTTKNIKNALNESYKKMPKEISFAFEKLARTLSSSYKYKEPIKEFASTLNYVWIYAFAEMLVMSYEGGGDISEDLLFLNEQVNDEIQADEENKTESTSNKLIFIIINIAALAAFLVNMSINDIASDLYFYTSAGNNIILFWVIELVLGLVVSAFISHI